MTKRAVQGSGFSSPERVHYVSVLRDLYEGILHPRQREVIAMKLDEDLSLAEMSERLGISRQACEDALKRAERALTDAEGRLGFFERMERETLCVEGALRELSAMTEANWQEARDRAILELIRCRESREGGETGNGV